MQLNRKQMLLLGSIMLGEYPDLLEKITPDEGKACLQLMETEFDATNRTEDELDAETTQLIEQTFHDILVALGVRPAEEVQ